MTGKAPKRKGDRMERALAAYFRENANVPAFRMPLSGGGKVVQGSGGADLLGTPMLFVESKAVERLNFHEAMRQAIGNARKTGRPDIPMVVNRRSRQSFDDSLVALRLQDFIRLYRALLFVEGYQELPPADDNADDTTPA